eukprot:TRINITY_DN4960_c2_g1_i1.p2 TRINITY_DN4960_c2_g1~~TRINITY_DN4960_c2_g1_i1.p2  ORF type:complete len:447 (+),score=132.49 TRINITY_DN4960_c2_g1_i1:86-1342(+)
MRPPGSGLRLLQRVEAGGPPDERRLRRLGLLSASLPPPPPPAPAPAPGAAAHPNATPGGDTHAAAPPPASPAPAAPPPRGSGSRSPARAPGALALLADLASPADRQVLLFCAKGSQSPPRRRPAGPGRRHVDAAAERAALVRRLEQMHRRDVALRDALLEGVPDGALRVRVERDCDALGSVLAQLASPARSPPPLAPPPRPPPRCAAPEGAADERAMRWRRRRYELEAAEADNAVWQQCDHRRAYYEACSARRALVEQGKARAAARNAGRELRRLQQQRQELDRLHRAAAAAVAEDTPPLLRPAGGAQQRAAEAARRNGRRQKEAFQHRQRCEAAARQRQEAAERNAEAEIQKEQELAGLLARCGAGGPALPPRRAGGAVPVRRRLQPLGPHMRDPSPPPDHVVAHASRLPPIEAPAQ